MRYKAHEPNSEKSPWETALVAFALVAAVVMALPALRAEEHLFGPPLTEDGYYALTVARNLAHGYGMTIDGTTLSNGFQPLFTVVEALAFAIGGDDDARAIRFVILFAWLFHAGGALLCGAVARDIWPARHGEAEIRLRAPLAAIFYLGSPLLFGHAYNGLATGCVMFFYLAVIRWLQIGGAASLRGRLVLGILVGLMVLARIDAAFFAIAIGLHLLWRNRHDGAATALLRAATVGVTAIAVSGPWWAYNILDFGSFLPTSGTALQSAEVVPRRVHHALWAVRAVLMPWLFFGQLDDYIGTPTSLPRVLGFSYVSLPSTLRLVLLVAVAYGFWRAARNGTLAADRAKLREEAHGRARSGLEAIALLLCAVACMIVYYTFYFGSYWFYYRYFMPLAVLPFVAAPVAAARAIAAAGRPRGLAAAVLLAVAVQAVGWPTLAFNGRTFNPNAVYFDQVSLVGAHVPDSEIVAAGQSGTLGFFRKGAVNTDGKVNLEALGYRGRIWEYLRARDVHWFADWPYYVNRHIGVPLDPATDLPLESGNGWRYVAEKGGFYLYRSEAAPP